MGSFSDIGVHYVRQLMKREQRTEDEEPLCENATANYHYYYYRYYYC